MELADVMRVYQGSDGDATKALYAQLEAFGPVGLVAVNLFRAAKCSERAKVYRGGIRGRGSFKSMAYDRKQWSMDNLCRVLTDHAASLGITWGWKVDPVQEFHRWVLYVDLPTGQCSFHTDHRGAGPDYAADWDQMPGQSVGRIVSYVARVLTADVQSVGGN